MSKTILIIDDHPVVLFGLKFLFQDDGRFSVSGEAGDAGLARSLAGQLQPDFIILDLVLGGRDGLELLKELSVLAPAARVLVYSSQNERYFARTCQAAGAWGYVPKSQGLPIVAEAIAAIAAGKPYFAGSPEADDDGAVQMLTLPALDQLSARELQVLRLIGQGVSTREISAALELSIKTVGTYRERIKTKLMLENVRDLDTLARDYVGGRFG